MSSCFGFPDQVRVEDRDDQVGDDGDEHPDEGRWHLEAPDAEPAQRLPEGDAAPRRHHDRHDHEAERGRQLDHGVGGAAEVPFVAGVVDQQRRDPQDQPDEEREDDAEDGRRGPPVRVGEGRFWG